MKKEVNDGARALAAHKGSRYIFLMFIISTPRDLSNFHKMGGGRGGQFQYLEERIIFRAVNYKIVVKKRAPLIA